ncbi:MAG: hypothetical protein V2A53_09975 [bacterium]
MSIRVLPTFSPRPVEYLKNLSLSERPALKKMVSLLKSYGW